MTPRAVRCQALRWIALLGVIVVVRTSAMKDTLMDSFRPDDSFLIIWEFQFAQGGQMQVEGTVTIPESTPANSSAQLLFCSDASLVSLKNFKMGQICARRPFDSADCVSVDVFKKTGSISISKIVPTNDWYFLLQLNCDELEYQVALKVAARNPGRAGYLSLSQAPFIDLSFAFTGVWALVALLFIFNWFPYRHFNVKLQSALTFVPGLLAAFNSIMISFWDYSSKFGKRPQLQYWIAFIVVVFSKGILFYLLLAVSRGWALVKRQLEADDHRQVLFLSGGLMLACAGFNLLGGIALFVLILVYALLCKHIFFAVNQKLIEIDAQMQLVRSAGLDPAKTPLHVKRHMYHNLHLIILSYVTVSVIFHLWATIFLMRMPWLADGIDSTLDVMMLVALGWNFRMRPFYPGFYCTDASVSTDIQGQSVPRERANSGSLNRHLLSPPLLDDDNSPANLGTAEWSPGMPIPRFVSKNDSEYVLPFLHPDAADPVVLVDNPVSASHDEICIGICVSR